MDSYIVIAKIPIQVSPYIKFFRREFLKVCVEKHWECIVDYLQGRIIVFSSQNPCRDVEKIRGVISCKRVHIFEEEKFDELLSLIIERLRSRNCRDFAVKSNRKEMEIKLGEKIVELTGLKVKLTDPDCEINVEKRGRFFLLI